MSNDLTLDAVDAIAAAKCAEIEAMRVLARLSPEDQRRLRHDFGFMARAGTFTPPGTMTLREVREAVHFGETVADSAKLDECLKHYDAFPSGKTRGQEVAEKYIATEAHDERSVLLFGSPGRCQFTIVIGKFGELGTEIVPKEIRGHIASLIDMACAAAVKEERERSSGARPPREGVTQTNPPTGFKPIPTPAPPPKRQ